MDQTRPAPIPTPKVINDGTLLSERTRTRTIGMIFRILIWKRPESPSVS